MCLKTGDICSEVLTFHLSNKCQQEILLHMNVQYRSFILVTKTFDIFFFLIKFSVFSIYHKIYFGESKHIDYILKLRLHIKNCLQGSNLMKVFITFQTTGLQVDFETLCPQEQYYVLMTEFPGQTFGGRLNPNQLTYRTQDTCLRFGSWKRVRVNSRGRKVYISTSFPKIKVFLRSVSAACSIP